MPSLPSPRLGTRICHGVAIFSLITLIALCLAWETVLAPLRPGGSWLMLKVLPLLFPLFGVLRGKRYTYQWACMLILLYFTEGVVRMWSDRPPSSALAGIEIILSAMFFIAAIYYAKLTARGNSNATSDSTAARKATAP